MKMYVNDRKKEQRKMAGIRSKYDRIMIIICYKYFAPAYGATLV